MEPNTIVTPPLDATVATPDIVVPTTPVTLQIPNPVPVISPVNGLKKSDLKAWAVNLLKFTSLILATFFGLLAQGVPVSQAWPVVVLAFYGAIADLLNKYKTLSVYPQG
jgi:hypothetical protein